MRRGPRRWLVILAVLAAPVLWLAPPVYPYRAACGERLQYPIHAELRPIFVRQLRQGFAEQEVPYFILFGRPYLTWFGHFDSLNWEKRYAFRIASGETGEPPPAIIQRLVDAWEHEQGERLERNRFGLVEHVAFYKLDECAVKRAALTYADGD